MAVEIDVQMKTFAVAAGVDLELRRFRYDELDVVVAALAQLVTWFGFWWLLGWIIRGFLV